VYFSVTIVCLAVQSSLFTDEGCVMAKKDSAEIQPESQGQFKALTFLQETKEELDKVVWPSRQQLISESAAVILMVSLSALLIYLVDQLFSWLATQVF